MTDINLEELKKLADAQQSKPDFSKFETVEKYQAAMRDWKAQQSKEGESK